MDQVYPLYAQTTFRGKGEIIPPNNIYHIGLVNPNSYAVELGLFGRYKRVVPSEYFTDYQWYQQLINSFESLLVHLRGIYVLSHNRKGGKQILFKGIDATGRIATIPMNPLITRWTIEGYVDYYQYCNASLGFGSHYEFTLEPKEMLDIYFLINNR